MRSFHFKGLVIPNTPLTNDIVNVYVTLRMWKLLMCEGVATVTKGSRALKGSVVSFWLFSLLLKMTHSAVSKTFFIHIVLLKKQSDVSKWHMMCSTSPAPSAQLRPFLPDRKLPQEQEFMVIGAQEPRVYLREWTNGTRHCQEFNFSTQLDCKLLEYRNLTLLQLLQPSVLQVAISPFI